MTNLLCIYLYCFFFVLFFLKNLVACKRRFILLLLAVSSPNVKTVSQKLAHKIDQQCNVRLLKAFAI